MEALIDPRGALPSSIIQPPPYIPRPTSNLLDYGRRKSSMNTLHKPRKDQCYDWIFSSSSNVHVATDRASFTSYYPFDSYALTLSDHRRVSVLGIGVVELRIRCKPGSRSHRTIILQNVLHIPSWLCNIFSDVYFQDIQGFDFTWNDFGVCFVVRDGYKFKPYGYTENFRGLDRLVLARKQDGRSPMLEDKEREIFSINVTWPQSQINKWEAWVLLQQECKSMNSKGKRNAVADEIEARQMNCSPRSESRVRKDGRGHRASVSNLRASLSMMSLSSLAKKMT